MRLDLREPFPVPLRHQEQREVGRQGVLGWLDEKEDQEASDAKWLALEHRWWCEELCRCHLQRPYLQMCIDARVDPGTGRAPRVAQAWAAIETRARAEMLRMDLTASAILSDYADHYGHEAAVTFAAFVDGLAQVLSTGLGCRSSSCSRAEREAPCLS